MRAEARRPMWLASLRTSHKASGWSSVSGVSADEGRVEGCDEELGAPCALLSCSLSPKMEGGW